MKDDIQKYVGKTGLIQVRSLKVEVLIKDVKNTYGRNRYLISPIRGSGEMWIETVILDTVKK